MILKEIELFEGVDFEVMNEIAGMDLVQSLGSTIRFSAVSSSQF